MTTQLKRQLLASQLTQKINENKEDTLRQVVSDFFRKQRNLVLAAFDEYYKEEMLLQGHIDLILAPIHELHQEYYELLLEHNLDMFHRGEDLAERLVERATNQQAMKAKRKKENIKITHDTINKYTEHFGTLQYSEDYLTNYTFTATEKTLSRVDAEINKILTSGYKEGWGVRDVRNRILQRYDQFETWEANRIARTEMQTAHNMGMMNKYTEMGVEYKEWRSAHDKRVRGNRKSDRANHIIMDGEIAPLDQPFSNGLMFPGDKNGKIEEWINCRCSSPPFIIPPGMMAPPGMAQFKESDLISVAEPNYGRLLQKETGGKLNWQQYKQILNGTPLEQVLSGAIAGATQTKQEPTPTENPKITELEKQIEETQALVDKWKSRGNTSLAKTFEKEVAALEKELNKLKAPKIKVIKEPKNPEIDIDKIMQDALREAGVSTKPKKKTKPKSKPKLKQSKPIEVPLEEHLRNNLPNELGDEAINYIADRVRKRGTVKYEYGQIFDYKTGKTHSPEFKGGKGSVHIKTEDWIKPVKKMTMEEQIDALSNPQKYKKSYINKSKSLASQHNHPPDGCRAPSGADFYANLIAEWEDYGFQISNEEVWCIEYKGKLNMIDAKEIEKGCDRAFSKAKRQATKDVMEHYDDLEPKEKSKMRSELIKDYYAENLLKYIEKNEYGIKLHRVVL